MTTRAERRRAEREFKRSGGKPAHTETIKLQNPVSEHFAAFIVGNATKAERVVQKNAAKGQHIVICGAGPSLAEHAAEWCPQGDQVWGCNSALTWLKDNGHKVTHGFTVDQTTHMVQEWLSAPDAEYLVASSVHPHLVEWLESKGRRLTFFHNYVGLPYPPVDMGGGRLIPYEDFMYARLFEPTVRVGSGLNAVTRAMDLAIAMGAAKITVLGADCALKIRRRSPNVPAGSPEHTKWLKEDVVMHADGGHALTSGATAVTLGGEIDGRWWETKPDMLITAVWMADMKKHLGDLVQYIGDTLPNALAGKDYEYLDRLPALTDTNGKPIRYTPPVLDI